MGGGGITTVSAPGEEEEILELVPDPHRRLGELCPGAFGVEGS